jgi:hypothetical protein
MELTWRYDNSGRIQPTEFGRMLDPGLCLLCSRPGRTQDEVFANLGVEIEYYGIAFLCLECCAEVADFINFVSPEKHANNEAEIKDLKDDMVRLKAQLGEAKGLLNARIDSAVDCKHDSDGTASIPFPKVDRTADEVNRILNVDKPKFSKSGTK